MTTPLGSASGTVTIHTGQALSSLAKLRAQSASTIGTLNQMGRAAIVGGAGVAALGGLIAYGLVRAAKTTADFEFKLSFLQATLKATDDQMVALRQSALDFGSTSGFGPREVADAFVELGKAGVSAQEIIGGVGKAVITLGQSADIGLAQAASIIVSTQATFQLLASEAQHTADVIQGAANASLIDVNDFGVTMKYVGNVAAAVGINLDDLSVAIAEVGNQGIRGSTAGTSLRRMLLQLTPRTDKAKQAMEELGIITKDGTNLFYDQTGSVKSLRDVFQVLHDKTVNLTDAKKKDTLATIFGDRAIATALATAKGGAALYDSFQKQIKESTAAEIAAKRFDNLQGAIRKFKGALEAAFITGGTPAQKPLQNFVETLTALVKMFNHLDPETQKNIVKTAAYAAGVLLLVGTLSVLVGTVMRAVAIYKQLRLVMLVATEAMAGATAASAILASALSAGLLIAVAAVIANLFAMGQGAADAARKIQEVEGALNFGDLTAVRKGAQDLYEFAAAQSAIVANKGLLQGALGLFTGSSTRSLKAANDAMAEADALTQRVADSTSNLKIVSKASGISFKVLGDTAKTAMIDMSADVNATARPLLEFYEKSVKGRVSASRLAAAVDDIAASADDATGQVESLDTALNNLASIQLDAEKSSLAFEKAVSDAKDSAKAAGKVYSSNGKLLHEGNKNSEDARAGLLDIADAGLSLYNSQLKAHASTTVLNTTMKNTRDAFIQAAMKMGMSQAAAKAYADQIGLVPPAKTTTVTIEGVPKAKKDLVTVETLIDRIIQKLKDPAELIIDVITNTKPDTKLPDGTSVTTAGAGADLILGPIGGKPATPPSPVKKVAPTLPSSRPPGISPSVRRRVSGRDVVAPQVVIPQSQQTTYELNGPVIANDPAQLQRELNNRRRLAALGGS